MNCKMSLALLSEYRDGQLNDSLNEQVRQHLSNCSPCLGIFRDIEIIVLRAAELRDESSIAFPDEKNIWRRMGIGRNEIL
jgi:predicted anti-sigma-YlaC factor YlaD